jgi:hypothetical protein
MIRAKIQDIRDSYNEQPIVFLEGNASLAIKSFN